MRHFAAALAAVLAAFACAAFAAPPQRIISLIPSTTEMLFAMGAGNRVIAVGTYDHFPADVEKLPRVGALLDPNTERILTMKPDLVVLYGTQTELVTALDRAKIPYYAYQHMGLPDITQTIRTLGARAGSSVQANALAARIEKQLSDIKASTATLDHPKTLLVFGREPGSLRDIDASGGIGFLHDMLLTAGGTDVLADMRQQSVMMSTEMVLVRAPDIIIEIHSPTDSGGTNDLSAWNTLASVPAVRTHRVYSLTGDEFVIPGPRVASATERMAKTLHPKM
ncbi:MAG TPA: ABC transporter substrate-binding protein [Vicinamibacterales bacterium]|nr:ABC transporter substrate-binding protein [Vicinamibacterales bacterium]